MNGFAGDRVLNENLCELNGILDRFYKNDDLIELELVNQVHQFGNLLTLIKLDIVLAETVKGQFALVLNQHFSRIAHKLTASKFNVT